MKKLFIIFSLLIISSNVFAGGRTYVRGHFRKDGAYVAPHYRTSPDGSFYNNWSTYGNINPYTGEFGKNLFPDKYKSHGYIKSSVPNFQLAPIPNEIGQTNRNNNKAITPDISSYSDINSPLPSEVGNWIEKNAQQKWPNDLSMQAYTMQTQKEGYLRLQSQKKSFSQVGIPDNIFTWCLNLSKKKWPEDFSMQAYTFENNLEGYLKLSHLFHLKNGKGCQRMYPRQFCSNLTKLGQMIFQCRHIQLKSKLTVFMN